VANIIGEFEFLTLHGRPSPPAEQVEVVARGGVDGLGIWRTGVRGQPFRMFSQVDAPSLEIAADEFERYQALIGQDPVEMVQDDVIRDWKVAVLGVQLVSRYAIMVPVGGLNFPSLAWLEAEWTLVAIAEGE